jgi:hypothetical protein
VAILLASRLRRSDPRSGWIVAVGGAFLTTAVLFSFAGGIFHPYYVSLLAPFAAALVGAGAAQLIGGGLALRVLAPLAVLAGVAVELVIRSHYPGQLSWLAGVLVVVGVLAALALVLLGSRRMRMAALGTALGALLIAPGVWAFDTLGYATSSTFPSGGPASVAAGVPGGFGGGFGRLRGGANAVGGQPLFGAGGSQARGGGAGEGPGAGGGPPASGGLPGAGQVPGGAGAPPTGAFPGGGGPPSAGGGGFGGNDGSLTEALSYVAKHGGGTIAVSSQSSAASAIIRQNANVAGIGGFSGRESDVSVAWLAEEVRSGKIRWVLGEQSVAGFGGRLAGDTRTGARTALAAVRKACRVLTLSSSGASATGSGAATGAGSVATTLYDCQGRAARLASAATGAAARESTL